MPDGLTSTLLSQDEIDSLMNMLADAPEEMNISPVNRLDVSTDMVRRYDFHQPDRFSKEHLRTLRMIHENLARRLSLQLSTKLRASVDVKLAYIETGPYANFVQVLSSSPSAMHLISMKPLPGRFLLQYDSRLGDMLVDRLLGGAGLPSHNAERELTDLEMDLLSSVTEDVMNAIRDSWLGTIELHCKLEEMLTNPYFVQVALPSDTCAWISFEMTLNSHGSALNFCIPSSVLKPITPRLSPQAWIAGTGQQSDEEELSIVRRHVRRHLENMDVELTALLPGGELLLSELMALEVGDVIPLQRHISEKIVLTMQEKEKLRGHLGVHRGKLAVEVTDVLEEEEATRTE